MENKKLLNISKFAELSGVFHNTIRNYQKRGVLPDRRNPLNNYRVFTYADLEKFKKVLSGEIRTKK